jgi:hypothetical protein
MASIPNETFCKVLLELFIEAYDGPTKSYTWFIDNAPKSGLLGTLEDITSEEASRPFVENGSTIAAHTEHLRWSLALANAYTRGENPQPKWSESWLVKQVNDASWQKLKADLRSEFEALQGTMQKQQDFSDEQMLTGVVALIPHAAYHLGSIRQMKKLLNKETT